MIHHLIKPIPRLSHEVGDVGLKLGITQLVVAHIVMLLDGTGSLTEGAGDVLQRWVWRQWSNGDKAAGRMGVRQYTIGAAT
jgi:hypothetical protein